MDPGRNDKFWTFLIILDPEPALAPEPDKAPEPTLKIYQNRLYK
jgi:hypothetical protein